MTWKEDVGSIPYERVRIDQLQPLYDNVLVKHLEFLETSGGLQLVNEGVKTECWFAKVLAVGCGQRSDEDGKIYPLDIQPGQTIITMGWSGAEFKYNLEKYRLVKNRDIWAIVELDQYGTVLKIEPYREKFIVRMIRKEQTQGGILLTQNEQAHETTAAEVLMVGPGARNMTSGLLVPQAFKVGDIVEAIRYSGADITFKGEKLRIMQGRCPEYTGDVHAIRRED